MIDHDGYVVSQGPLESRAWRLSHRAAPPFGPWKRACAKTGLKTPLGGACGGWNGGSAVLAEDPPFNVSAGDDRHVRLVRLAMWPGERENWSNSLEVDAPKPKEYYEFFSRMVQAIRCT